MTEQLGLVPVQWNRPSIQARSLNERGVADAFLELIFAKLVKPEHNQQKRSSFIIVLNSLFMGAEAAARVPPLLFLILHIKLRICCPEL
jgi:hypothetical protein